MSLSGDKLTRSTNNNQHYAKMDDYQKRSKNLEKILLERVKRKITETNERIQRYSEEQFALLKRFREKSQQEYENLISLVQQVPENFFNIQHQ